jgi:hypothetical protein
VPPPDRGKHTGLDGARSEYDNASGESKPATVSVNSKLAERPWKELGRQLNTVPKAFEAAGQVDG